MSIKIISKKFSEQRHPLKVLQEEGILLEENKNWEGSFFVDLRNKKWTKHILETIIPNLLNQKFDGIFIDTIDNAEYLESLDLSKYFGMKKAAIHLIKQIRSCYPSIKIMLNRGFAILPDVASDIDMAAAESICTEYDFGNNRPKLVPEGKYQAMVHQLKKAKTINSKLEIYTLDYWDPNDKAMIGQIYQTQRSHGFIPYVSTIQLNRVLIEP